MQESEKDLLAKELPKLEKKEDIEKFAEDAVLLGHEDIAQLAREKITALEAKAEEVAPSIEAKKDNVESLGGSTEKLQEEVASKDAEIAEVKAETVQKIEEVEKGPIEVNQEVQNENKEINDFKKDFHNIEKPKKPEEIEKYRESLHVRFKELPEEYKKCVEDFIQIINNNPETEELVSRSFGVDIADPIEKKRSRDNILETFKTMPIGVIYEEPNKVFKMLVEKYPDKKANLDKMNSLIREHMLIRHENNEYSRVQEVYDNPARIENLFKYSNPKETKTIDEPNMNLINGWFNSSVGKKLVELGVITQEDLNKKLNDFLHEAEEKDEYLINEKKYPKEYEERINKFKQEFGIAS